MSKDHLQHSHSSAFSRPLASALSRRELQILPYLAEGWRTHEIAAEIGLAPESVRGYIDRIKDKLGARARADIVTIAWRRGILVLEEGQPAQLAA
jgi:two-component system nitrate/nitrite response regulator NarL